VTLYRNVALLVAALLLVAGTSLICLEVGLIVAGLLVGAFVLLSE
jgi:hypothetical protein